MSVYRNILYKLRKDIGTAQNDVSSTGISISIRRVSKLEILEKGRISEKKKKKKKKKKCVVGIFPCSKSVDQ